MFNDDVQRFLTPDENTAINAFVKSEYPLADYKQWVIWDTTKDGAFWYTLLDEQGFPSDDNVIEGETGEKMYLDRADACKQWGHNVGLISLDNGLSYKSVDDLSDKEIDFVLADIESRQPRWFPEICALCDDLDGVGDNNREWLNEFMSRLCSSWTIG